MKDKENGFGSCSCFCFGSLHGSCFFLCSDHNGFVDNEVVDNGSGVDAAVAGNADTVAAAAVDNNAAVEVDNNAAVVGNNSAVVKGGSGIQTLD